MTTTKQYDHLNRLTQISSQPSASGVPPVAFNYNCNTANQRTKDVLADGSYWIYTYDSLGQVISGHKYFYDNTPVPGQQFDYTFDTIGNRTQTKVGGDQTGGNQRVANYSANNLNQITSRDYPGTNDIIGAALATNSVTVNSQTAFHKGEYFWGTIKTNNTTSPAWLGAIVNSGGISTTGNVYLAQTPEHFSYDADGNLTNDGRWAYTWDAENRLVCMTVNTNVGPQYQLSFVYDSGGRRIQKLVVTNNVAQCTNTFLYNGWNLIAETAPNNSLVRGYVWGNDLSGSLQGAGGVGGLLEVSYYGTSTTNCFAAFNGNGNIAMLANTADGTTIANYEYGPFGEVIRATGPMARANPIRFSTKYQDDESDLLYYGYRYYKASTGTWLNRDPMYEKRGGKNLYCFVANSPLGSTDPDGRFSINWDSGSAYNCGGWKAHWTIDMTGETPGKEYIVVQMIVDVFAGLNCKYLPIGNLDTSWEAIELEGGRPWGDNDDRESLPGTIGLTRSTTALSALFDATSPRLAEIQGWQNDNGMYVNKNGPPSFWNDPIATATRTSWISGGWNCCCGKEPGTYQHYP